MSHKTARLRSIIRDMILAEAPLVGDGIYRYEVDPITASNIGTNSFGVLRPAVSYKLSADPAWREQARVLMRNTEENWAIVTFSVADTYGHFARDDTKWSQFNQWIREQGIPKGTRIIVIGSPTFAEDYDSVLWAVGHDIFGHTLAEFVLKTEPSPNMIRMIHESLPETAQLATDLKDFLPDIYAAIFLKIVSREYFDELLESNKLPFGTLILSVRQQIRDQLAAMFEGVDEWIAAIPVDKPHVIYPWNL